MSSAGQSEGKLCDYNVAVLKSDTGRFIENAADDTVTDTETGLMWLKDNASQAEMGWELAMLLCENSSFADYDDWRLPNRKELQSIMDYSKTGDFAIYTDFFSNKKPSYWSSTSDAASPKCVVLEFHRWQRQCPTAAGKALCACGAGR